MKMCLKVTQSEAIQEVDDVFFFIGADLEIFSISSQASAVNGCRQQESNQLLKHHNNPQVIHVTSVHQLKSVCL